MGMNSVPNTSAIPSSSHSFPFPACCPSHGRQRFKNLSNTGPFYGLWFFTNSCGFPATLKWCPINFWPLQDSFNLDLLIARVLDGFWRRYVHVGGNGFVHKGPEADA